VDEVVSAVLELSENASLINSTIQAS
jgi:hypothetical protein